MDKFIQRLKYYGLGFGLGLVFVFLFFENRGCSWLPSNRVKNSILDRVIVISDSTAKLLSSKKIHTKDVIALLNSGSVEFGESLKEGHTKIYKLSNDKLALYFTLPKDHFISEAQWASKLDDVKSSSKGTGQLIHFPKEPNLVYVDSTDALSCKMAELNIMNAKSMLKLLKKNGKINFGQTFYYKKPRPTAELILTTSKGKSFKAISSWYKTKITIKELTFEGDTICN